jgi:hypothetical protein
MRRRATILATVALTALAAWLVLEAAPPTGDRELCECDWRATVGGERLRQHLQSQCKRGRVWCDLPNGVYPDGHRYAGVPRSFKRYRESTGRVERIGWNPVPLYDREQEASTGANE